MLDVLSSEDFALCSNINTMLQNQRSTVSFCKVLKEKLAECVEMPNVQSQHRDELRGQIKESLSKFRNNLKINKSRLGAGNKNVENRYNEISDALEVLGKRFGN